MPVDESKLARSSLNTLAPNNSDKVKKAANNPEKKKKFTPIVKDKVVLKKKNVWDKFKDAFFGDTDNIGDYILYDVLVPAFRGTLSDLGIGIIEQIFGGATGGRSNRNRNSVVRNGGRSYISYNDAYARNYRNIDQGARARHDFDNVIFSNRGEAEDVLAHLVDIIVEYGEVTVRAFYELSNIESSYTDEKYGWTNLRDAYVTRTRSGHIIIFPPTRLL